MLFPIFKSRPIHCICSRTYIAEQATTFVVDKMLFSCLNQRLPVLRFLTAIMRLSAVSLLIKLLKHVISTSFVFSNQLSCRLYRHTCFWLCWYLFQVYLYSFTPSPMLGVMSFWSRIQINLIQSFIYLIPNIFLAYGLLYWAIPKWIVTDKYIRAVLSVLLLFILTGGISALVSLTIIDYFTHLLFAKYVANPSLSHMPVSVRIFLAWISGLRGSITIGGLAASIKLMKYFYEKQQQTLMLQQEKAIAELQSLKAQLHPHFLFNTLNNIYSHTQDTAPVAADMLLGLSALLRYMLYYCNAPLVPLKQETTMLLEYIELEKKRYGNQLEIAVQLPDNFENLVIAPLLILPFVENCFKHGTSNVLEKPWINIHVVIKNEWMQLKLINGKAGNTPGTTGGIGINNVRKRLALLYPQQHHLQIIEEEETYIVNLSIALNRAD